MKPLKLLRTSLTASLALTIAFAAAFVNAQQTASRHLFFHITLSPELRHPVSGRLLLFVSPGHGATAVDVNMMSPASTYIAAKEIASFAPGQTIDIDANETVFPAPLSQAPE